MRRTEEYVQLETIGKAIVKKCGGVPLAINALGSLMRLKITENEWISVQESDIWDLPDNESIILPALRISYDYLSPHLRQCFAYCCVFPKDYVMERDRLIQLWMANGFIPSRGRMDLHDMGHEIFSELVWRSFILDVKEDWRGDITCKMHDLVHDLALSIMRDEYSLVECSRPVEVLKNVRHLSINSSSSETIPCYEDLPNTQSVRSLILIGSFNSSKDLPSYCFKQKYLRALDLSGFTVEKLPMSIGKLKHLRYLNLSGSPIKTLPESTSCIRNLQTLKLKDCYMLHKLPKDMKSMRNLRYLDNRGCSTRTCMPAGMGQLTNLCRLGIFIVGKDNGHHIGELKGMNLRGGLIIKELNNVRNLRDAKYADLIGKQKLQSLILSWQEDNKGNPPENAEEVLSGLQPHSNLKKLDIYRYRGSKFPDWMMDLLLPNLVKISLHFCGRCEHLPPLGKLPFLKSIILFGMDALESFGNECYGDRVISFPVLESLRLNKMPSLKEWTTMEGREVFPKLRYLSLEGCPKLVEFPILPSVKTLVIWEINPVLLNSVMNYTFLTSLMINCESTALPDGLLQNHTLLEKLIICLPTLKSLSNQLDNLSALKSLTILFSYELESLPEGLQNLNSLETLEIYGCRSLVSFPVNGLRGLSSLRLLWIENSEKLASLSEGVQYLTALEDLFIKQCPELKALPEELHSLTTIKKLTIEGCPHLERRYKKEIGEEWPNIAHIPIIEIGASGSSSNLLFRLLKKGIEEWHGKQLFLRRMWPKRTNTSWRDRTYVEGPLGAEEWACSLDFLQGRG